MAVAGSTVVRTQLWPVQCLLLLILSRSQCNDITNQVFGGVIDGMPAAFGDFNSDELTDVFVLRDNDRTVEILLTHEEEPLLRPSQPHALRCTFLQNAVTSVVPGDFDGDAFMDVLVTIPSSDSDEIPKYSVFVLWGGANHLNCTQSKTHLMLTVKGEPLAIDYNQDMIVDLFGVNSNDSLGFWVFHSNRTPPEWIPLEADRHFHTSLRHPHSHAFIDLNKDYMADLFLTTNTNFEIWYATESSKKFINSTTIDHPPHATVIGQSLFMDVELKEQMDLVVPICSDTSCTNSALVVYSAGVWHDLHVNFKDDNGILWRYAQRSDDKYTNMITLHSGDFNLDGYPDLLVTLVSSDSGKPSASVFMENVACETGCGTFKRTFTIRWQTLNEFLDGTTMAVFFDFYQDGVLDILLVRRNRSVAAFKNSLDYDANFMKVMVLTGLTSSKSKPTIMGRVGKKRRTYGTNLPGPFISYRTTTQDGVGRCGAAAQLPQSAHNSLILPYTIFGLGRMPNFVDSLTVGLSNHSRTWMQIIPNSQLVVIPWPVNQPNRWKAQLFVTPSKLILMSVAALTTICGVITVIIGGLHWKERQEDKKERLSESHRFHFDAM